MPRIGGGGRWSVLRKIPRVWVGGRGEFERTVCTRRAQIRRVTYSPDPGSLLRRHVGVYKRVIFFPPESTAALCVRRPAAAAIITLSLFQSIMTSPSQSSRRYRPRQCRPLCCLQRRFGRRRPWTRPVSHEGRRPGWPDSTKK